MVKVRVAGEKEAVASSNDMVLKVVVETGTAAAGMSSDKLVKVAAEMYNGMLATAMEVTLVVKAAAAMHNCMLAKEAEEKKMEEVAGEKVTVVEVKAAVVMHKRR